MKSFVLLLSSALLFTSLVCSGCQGYTRGSAVPEDLRTVHVAAFENQTLYPKAGAIATQQLIDAMLEEGTFRPGRFETARLRVQGIMTGPETRPVSYDRNNIIVPDEYRMTLRVNLYVYDAQTGDTLINGKPVEAMESMLTRGDYQTGVMDALPRASRKLAQAILAELHTLDGKPPVQEAEETPPTEAPLPPEAEAEALPALPAP